MIGVISICPGGGRAAINRPALFLQAADNNNERARSYLLFITSKNIYLQLTKIVLYCYKPGGFHS
jgi:hypothetical protein